MFRAIVCFLLLAVAFGHNISVADSSCMAVMPTEMGKCSMMSQCMTCATVTGAMTCKPKSKIVPTGWKCKWSQEVEPITTNVCAKVKDAEMSLCATMPDCMVCNNMITGKPLCSAKGQIVPTSWDCKWNHDTSNAIATTGLDKCSMCQKVMPYAISKIEKWGCGLVFKGLAIGTCELIGLGPEDPLSDICAVMLVGGCSEILKLVTKKITNPLAICQDIHAC